MSSFFQPTFLAAAAPTKYATGTPYCQASTVVSCAVEHRRTQVRFSRSEASISLCASSNDSATRRSVQQPGRSLPSYRPARSLPVPPHFAFQGNRRMSLVEPRGKHEPKTQVVVAEDRVPPAAAGTPAVAGIVSPATAPGDAEAACCIRKLGAAIKRCAFVSVVPDVLAPFPNVSVHIEQSPAVGQLLPSRPRATGRIRFVPDVFAQQLFGVAERVFLLALCPAGIFPFGFTGKPVSDGLRIEHALPIAVVRLEQASDLERILVQADRGRKAGGSQQALVSVISAWVKPIALARCSCRSTLAKGSIKRNTPMFMKFPFVGGEREEQSGGWNGHGPVRWRLTRGGRQVD